MSKNLLLTISSVFLIWQSYKLLLFLSIFRPSSWPLIILFAWLINLFVTGVFAFAGLAYPTQRLLPYSYYHISQPRRLSSICKFLRVDLFRGFLLATFWRSKEQRIKHFDGTKAGISNLQIQSKKSEIGHLLPFLILVALSVFWIATGKIKLGFTTLVINFIGNFYPILLQRHHRMRIQAIASRYKA